MASRTRFLTVPTSPNAWLAPTTTLGTIVSASSTHTGGLSIDFSTTTRSTTTSAFFSNASSTYSTSTFASIQKLFDANGSAGNSGQFLTSNGSTTAWASTSTLAYLSSLNGLTVPYQSFASSSPTTGGWGFSSSGSTHTLTIPTAGVGSDRGLLTAADWTTFNNKQAAISAGANISLTGATINSLALATSSISTSALLAGILTDETGSAGGGLAVFSNSPTFTGTASFGAIFSGSTTLATLLTIPTSTTPAALGQIAVKSAPNGLFAFLFGTSSVTGFPAVLPSYQSVKLNLASSTWTGTTSVEYATLDANERIVSGRCYTDAGSLIVRVGNGTNWSNQVSITTSTTTVTFGSNNLFNNGGTKIIFQVGTPATTPKFLSYNFRDVYELP